MKPHGVANVCLQALLSLSACGGDGAVTPTPTPSAAPPPVLRLLAVSVESIESFTVEAGDGRLVLAPRLTMASRALSAIATVTGDRLYLAGVNGLEGFRMDAVRGTLTPLPGSPYATRISFLSPPTPSGAIVYAHTSERAILAMRVESSGALVEVGRTAGPQFQGPVELEPSGRYAYGFAGQALSGYRVEGSGVLTALPGSPYPLPRSAPNPGGLKPARVGPFLYTLSQGDGVLPGGVQVYRFDPVSGIPDPLIGYRAPENRVPSALDISPSGGTLYVSYRPRFVTDPAPVFVQAYAVDGATGTLGAVGSLDVGRSIFSEMRVSPDGRSLFLTLEPSRFEQPFPPTLVAAVNLDPSGQPVAVAGAPQIAGIFPHSLLAFVR